MMLISFGLGALVALFCALLFKRWHSKRVRRSFFERLTGEQNWFY